MTEQVKERVMTEEEREEERKEQEEPKEHRLTTADVAGTAARPATAQEEVRRDATPLLPGDKATDFRGRWNEIQTSFVDEPRHSVEEADALVAEVMQHLAKTFADERQNLESQWGRGDNVSTEDLRIALQRYRSFFTRLLSV